MGRRVIERLNIVKWRKIGDGCPNSGLKWVITVNWQNINRSGGCRSAFLVKQTVFRRVWGTNDGIIPSGGDLH